MLHAAARESCDSCGAAGVQLANPIRDAESAAADVAAT